MAAALSTTGVLDGDVGARRSGTNRRTRPHGPTHVRFHHRWSRIGGRGAPPTPPGERPLFLSAFGGGGGSPFPGGGCSGGRVPSTGWCGCAGSGRTTIIGHSSATAAGATRTCYRSQPRLELSGRATD